MNSFFFWLTAAAALGALLSTMLYPGFPEIVITLAVLNTLFYGVRSLARLSSEVAGLPLNFFGLRNRGDTLTERPRFRPAPLAGEN